MKKLHTYLFPAVTGIIVFIMYLLTLAPSVVQIDAGELAAVQITAGIAHPTGYPFYTIIGHVFSQLPLPFRPIYSMNLLAALYCAGAIVVFGFLMQYLLAHISVFMPAIRVTPKKSKKKNQQKDSGSTEKVQPEYFSIQENARIAGFASALGGLMLAFSKTYWMQSTSVEVYSAQILLFLVTISFILRAYIITQENPEKSFVAWAIATGMLAVSFSNHMTTLFLLPAGLFFFFSSFGFSKKTFITMGKLLIPFFIILAGFYSYLPLRAAQHPAINWGNPVDWEHIYRHISGKQYQVWLFSSFASAGKQLSYFCNNFPSEFNISLVFVLLGMYFSFKNARKLFWFISITAVFCVLYSINYDINDIDSYFLLTYICLGLFASFGVVQLFKLLYDSKFQYGLALTASIVFIGVQIYFTADKVDQHDNYAFEDYSKAALQSVQPNSIIFTYEWDYLVSPSYYFQMVEKFRPDVAVVDKELLRRSWYYNQLNRNYPYLLTGVTADVDAFLKGLINFERDKPFDPGYLENFYRRIMAGLIETNFPNHPYYVAVELYEAEMQRGEFTLPQGYTLVPDIFFFRVIQGNQYTEAPKPEFKLRFPKNSSSYTENIKKMVCSMLVRRALYEMEFDKVDRAKLYIKKLRTDFPDYELPQGLAEVIVNN